MFFATLFFYFKISYLSIIFLKGVNKGFYIESFEKGKSQSLHL